MPLNCSSRRFMTDTVLFGELSKDFALPFLNDLSPQRWMYTAPRNFDVLDLQAQCFYQISLMLSMITSGARAYCVFALGIKTPTGHLTTHSPQDSHLDVSPKKAILPSWQHYFTNAT